MSKRYPASLLRRLRNEIPTDWLIGYLNWPHKHREGCFVFVCPCCGESLSKVKRSTNLGRCFVCERNFNPLEFVMASQGLSFVDSVEFLKPLLRG